MLISITVLGQANSGCANEDKKKTKNQTSKAKSYNTVKVTERKWI